MGDNTERYGLGVRKAMEDIRKSLGADKPIQGPEIHVKSDVVLTPDDVDFEPVKKAIEQKSQNSKQKIKIPVEIEPQLNKKEKDAIANIIKTLDGDITEETLKKSRGSSGRSYQAWLQDLVGKTKKQQRNTYYLGEIEDYVKNIKMLQSIVNGSVKPRGKNFDLTGIDLDFLKNFSVDDINKRLEQQIRHRINLDQKYPKSSDLKQLNVQIDTKELQGEIDALGSVKSAVENITTAIDSKNTAFRTEAQVVKEVVEQELADLNKLESKLNTGIVSAAQNAGGAISGAVSGTSKNVQATIVSQPARAVVAPTNANGNYPWGNGQIKSLRKLSGYMLHDADISGIVNSIIKLTDTGSLDVQATLDALIKFKDALGDPQQAQTVYQLYDAILQLRAFNDVLSKLQTAGANIGALTEIKPPGQNNLENKDTGILYKLAKEYNAQFDSAAKTAQQQSAMVVDSTAIVENKEQELQIHQEIVKAIEDEEELTKEELEYAEQLKAELEAIGEQRAKNDAAALKEMSAEQQRRIDARKAAGLPFGEYDKDGNVIWRADLSTLNENGLLPFEQIAKWEQEHFPDQLNKTQSGNAGLDDKKLLELNGHLEVANERLTGLNSALEKVQDTLSNGLGGAVEKVATSLSDFSAKQLDTNKATSIQSDYNENNAILTFEAELHKIVSDYIDEMVQQLHKVAQSGLAEDGQKLRELYEAFKVVEKMLPSFNLRNPDVDVIGNVLSQHGGNKDVSQQNVNNIINDKFGAVIKNIAHQSSVQSVGKSIVGDIAEEQTELLNLKEIIDTDIPAAIKSKNDAFESERTTVFDVIEAETGQFGILTDSINGVQAAVNNKTEAFEEEHANVLKWVKEEQDALETLAEKAGGVAPKLSPQNHNQSGNRDLSGSGSGSNNGSPTVTPASRRGNNWNLPGRISALRNVDWTENSDGNLSSESIRILTQLLRNGKSQLRGYYKGARQIATGKFNLDKLDDFYQIALYTQDIIEALPDIEKYANLPKLNGQTQKIEDANPELKQVYEAYREQQDAIVNVTSKLLEQGNLISDISGILYDGSKTLIDRMNELAAYSIENAGAIHSAYNKTEQYDDAKAALKYLGRNAGKHYINNALDKEGLLKKGPASKLGLENNEWDYQYAIIKPFIEALDAAPDEIRKKIEQFLKAVEHIKDDVVGATVEAERQRAADLTANSLENNSPLAKAYRAYGRLSKRGGANGENYFQTLSLFNKNGMLYGVKDVDKLPEAEVSKLLADQTAKLEDLKQKREENLKLVKAIEGTEAENNEALQARKQIWDEVQRDAEQYAKDRLREARSNSDNPYNNDIDEIYDAFYRKENFFQKQHTVGITDLENQALQEAINKYEELKQKLIDIAEKGKDVNAVLTEEEKQQSLNAEAALKTISIREREASSKLKNKWSDIRDRRYGSYLNEDDTTKYRSRADVLAGLQRYATREGAKDFKLFDGKSTGDIQKYRAEVENTDGTIEKLNLTLNKTTGELYSVSMGTKQQTTFFESFGEGLKKRAIGMVQYIATFASLRTAIQVFRTAISNVKELDSAFVELSRISRDSTAALEEFRKKSFDVADVVGATSSQVINAAAQWEHLGYNVKESAELAEVSMIYKNIADGMANDAEATEDLVAIMKAYDKSASEAIDVTDALIAVSNNYAVTAADIGNALKRSASAMAVANNSFEQNVALATAMAEVTQNAEKSGSALAVLSLRIRGAKTELQEMGEDTDDMASSTSKLRAQVKGLTKGFDIMKDDKTFKQTYEIMEGISKVWKDLDDISRASLLETLAGKVRANQVAALLDNFDQARKVLQTIAEDEGTAIANNEAKLNSIEGRIAKFKNATQHLTADIFQPELIKDVIAYGTKLVSLLDTIVQKFGTFTPIAGMLGAATTVKGGGLVGELDALTKGFLAKRKYGEVNFTDGQIEAFSHLVDREGLDNALDGLEKLTEGEKEVLKWMGTNKIYDQDKALISLGESAKESGAKFIDFNGILNQVGNFFMNAAIAAGISFAISKIIEFGVAVANYKKSMSDLRSSYGQELTDYNKSLDDYKGKITNLNDIINDESSSIEQVTQARKDLRDIQEQIIGMCGSEADALGLVTDAINGQTDALDKLGQKKYNELLDEYANKRNSASGIVGRAVFGLGDKANGRATSNTAQQEIQASIESYTANLGELYQGLTIPEITEVFKDFERGALDNNVTGHVDDIISATESALDVLEKYQDKVGNGISREAYDKYERVLNSVLSQARADREGSIELYDMMLQYELLPKDAEYREANRKVQEAQKKFSQAKNTDEENAAIESFNNVIQGVAGENKDRILALFKDLYPVLYAEAEKWEFEVQLKVKDSDLRQEIQEKIDAISRAVGHTVTQEELNGWNESTHDDVANAAYGAYTQVLGKHGMGVQTGGEYVSQAGILSTDGLEAFKDKLTKDYGDIVDQIDKGNLAAVKSVNNLPAKFDAAYKRLGKNVRGEVNKINTALQMVAREEEKTAQATEKQLNGMDLSDVAKHLSKLNDVYDKLKKDGKVKWNTIDTKDFKEAFGDIKDETGEFQKAWDDFHKILSSTPNDTKAVQDAFDALASAYVYNSDCINMLNENNKDLVIGMLEDNGVLNATEVVEDALARKSAAAQYDAFSNDLLAQTGVNLANVTGESAGKTLEGAEAFLKQAGYAQEDQAAIARLILEQWALNGSPVNTEDSCNALAQLASMAGVATSQIMALNAAMAGAGGIAEDPSLEEAGVYDTKAYYESQRKKQQDDVLKQVKDSYKPLKLGGGGGSGGGGGGGGGGGNKEPSKTDKEFDYVNRALQIMQEQNEELREKVDNQYVILQDAEDNAEEFRDAIGRLGEAEQELNALGVYYGEDEFTEFLETLDLSEAAENIASNVEEIEDAYDGLNTILDDTPGYVKPIGVEERMDAAEEKADELQQVIEELFGDPQLAANTVGGGAKGGETFLGADINDYDKVVAAAKKYKQALGDVEKARDKTSKTLDENGTGQLTFIKQLQESDKQLIAAYEHAADSYKTEWEDYKEKILEAFKEDGQGEKYIQDIMFGNLDPEEWERMITYDSNDQAAKDRVELLERGQTAYDHQKESLKSMREWQQKLNEDVQKEYEMRLNIVKAEMVAIESRMNEAQFNLDMKEILGEVVQESDYQALIDISDEQIANYEKQLDVLNEQLDSLDEGEQAWYDCKSQIADCENAIRDCVKQQAEWNDTILRMPVENISRFLGLVKNLGQVLNNWLSVNDAKGIAKTAEQIQTSWDTAFDQIADDELGIMKQLEEYEELLSNYDLGSTKFSEVDDEIASACDSMEALVSEMIELNKQLLMLPIDRLAEVTTYLDGTMSDLQSVQSEYETTINTVVDLITHETEKIQDEYDELQKQIEDQIKPLQDQIDSLTKANDQRDRELQIENALYELEKAREQRTVQVIRDGRVTYETDESAIRNAQSGYDDALFNKLTGDLQDKIDELNDQLAKAEEATNKEVDALNDMLKNRWETIMPDTERNRNQEIASQFFMDMFGVQNWKELVLAGKDANGIYADEAIYQGTRAGYEQNSVEMRDTQRQIDLNNFITDTLTQYVEDFQQEKITADEMNAKISVLNSLISDGLITGQERLENTLTMGDYSNLGAALRGASEERNNQLDFFRENLYTAQDNRDALSEYETNWADFKAWYDETRQQLYEQYKLIDFIGDTVKKWYDDDDDDDDGNYSWDGPSSHWDEDHYYGGGSHGSGGYYDSDSGAYYFAQGLEKGSVGNMTSSDKFKAIQALGLRKLNPDEFPAILHLGEGVMNRQQQSTMLDNFRSALALGASGSGAVIQMSFGDISLPNVTNGQDFAESLAMQFQPAMNQVFSKIFHR